MKKALKPILKWAGGKEQELKYIKPELPSTFENFYEPFVGGGAVYFSIGNSHKRYINDKSYELIELYKLVSAQDKVFLATIQEIINDWDSIRDYVQHNSTKLSDIYINFSNGKISAEKLKSELIEFFDGNSQLFQTLLKEFLKQNAVNFKKETLKSLSSKMLRMRKIEETKYKLPIKDIIDNIEGAIKAAYYTHLRGLYNLSQKIQLSQSQHGALFFFIRNYAYSGMFRYNSKGDFNVPYGGIGYNKKSLSAKLNYMKDKGLVSYLYETQISNLDFEEFFKLTDPKENDFIFLDPPYDTEFSTYAKNEFTKKDQERLATYLINHCKAKWMIVIKNTPFIFELYNKQNLYISSFEKNYLVSFQNRNDKSAEHLLIKNYV